MSLFPPFLVPLFITMDLETLLQIHLLNLYIHIQKHIKKSNKNVNTILRILLRLIVIFISIQIFAYLFTKNPLLRSAY